MNWVLGTLAAVAVVWKTVSWIRDGKNRDAYQDKNGVWWTIYRKPNVGSYSVYPYVYQASYDGPEYAVLVSETAWPTAFSKADLLPIVDAYAATHLKRVKA